MEILPPKRVWIPAPIFPTMERDRTVIPRTSPSCLVIRYPPSSNAVVTSAWSTVSSLFQFGGRDDFVERREIHILLRAEPVQRKAYDLVVLDEEIGAAAGVLPGRVIDPQAFRTVDRRVA